MNLSGVICFERNLHFVLATEAEFLDDGTIAVDVLLCEVVEHTTTLTYEHLHRAAGGEILVVGTKVLGEVCNTE